MPFPVPPPDRGRPRPRPSHTEEVPTTSPTTRLSRLIRHLPAVVLPAAVLVVVLLVAAASPAFAATGSAATSLTSVINNLTDWLVGLLATVATLFLTVGGLRYLTAGGDPGQIEKAKTALKSAAIGYALAALAPLLVSVLGSLFR